MDERNAFFKSLDFNICNIETEVDDKIIGVYINPTVINNYYCQVILEASVNMLCRIYSNIVLYIPEKECILQYNRTTLRLDKYILGIARDSREGKDDNINLEKDLSKCHAVVCIGPHDEEFEEERTIYLSANGWLAGISRVYMDLGNNEDFNPLGATAAACLGVAEVFKMTFKDRISRPVIPVSGKFIFSTFDYSNNNTSNNPKIDSLDIDSAVLFGVGSVGSSMLYTMKFFKDVKGTLEIVDTDKEVESRNLLRYNYLTASDIPRFKGVEKVHWIKEKLRIDCPSLNIIPYICNVKEYSNKKGMDNKVNIAISAVDNVIARRDITDILARRTLNAGTGDVRFSVSRHGFNDGSACLYCNYINVNQPPANNYQQYSQMTSIPVARIYTLMEDNAVLDDNDFTTMINKGIVTSDMRDLVIGKPLMSFIHERFYGQMQIDQSESKKVITVSFVTLMAGCLLFGELVKETLGLQNSWKGTLYEQDMLALPNEMKQERRPNDRGLCLCQNSFRRMKYDLMHK